MNKVLVNSNEMKNNRDLLKQSFLDREKNEYEEKMKGLQEVEENKIKITRKYERWVEEVDKKRIKKSEKIDL